MSPEWLIVSYCLLIVAASLVGGWLTTVVRLSHFRMQLLMSAVAGLMLGVGLFHMLPHAVHTLSENDAGTDALDRSIWWMVIGFLVMFFLVRAFQFHQHGPAETIEAGDDPDYAQHGYNQRHEHSHRHKLSWAGVAFGLALHTLLDGLALAASVKSESSGHASGWLFGLGTFLAVLLHKPLDSMSITALMAAGGWSVRARHLVNLCFSMMCPLGAALFILGVERLTSDQSILVGCALAFSAGVFLCISAGDLLPEIHFHSHDRVKLSAALLAGVLLAYAIGFLEPEQMHSHQPANVRDQHSQSSRPALAEPGLIGAIRQRPRLLAVAGTLEPSPLSHPQLLSHNGRDALPDALNVFPRVSFEIP